MPNETKHESRDLCFRCSSNDAKISGPFRRQANPGTEVKPDAVAAVASSSARAEHSLSQEIPHHAPYLLGSSGHRRERVRGSSATGTRGGARGRGRGTGVGWGGKVGGTIEKEWRGRWRDWRIGVEKGATGRCESVTNGRG